MVRGRYPVLVDADRTVLEASIIVEHLGLHHPGPVRLIPEDARAALDVRMMDRVFDNYIATPMQKIVLDSIRTAETRDRQGVIEARKALDVAYGWLDGVMRDREWTGRRLQSRRLRGRTGAVLCRLGPPDRRSILERPRLSAAVARAAVVRASGGRGAPLSRVVSARSARP